MIKEFDSNKLIDTISFMCSKKNISANKMLLECNLNKSVLDNLKKGSIPSVDKIMKVADYFNVSVDYLLGRTDNPKMQSTTVDQSQTVSINGVISGNIGNISNSHFEISEEDMELIQLFHKLSIQKRAEIIMLMVKTNE